MKKRILQLFVTAASILCCVLCASVAASAARPLEDTIPSCKLYDEDQFFSAEEQETIHSMIREISDKIDMYVAVCVLDESGENVSDDSAAAYANDLYDELFNIPYGKETDGVMLLLNMPTHYIYISTCGLGELYYYNGSMDDRVSAMWQNMVSYMQDADYIGALDQFCYDLEKYKDMGMPKNAYTYNSDNGQYAYEYKGELCFVEKLPWWFGVDWKLWGTIAAVVGIITGLATFLIVRSQYKLVKSLDASNYISHKDTRYIVNNDVFIRKHTSKTRISSDSSGGGGGGGGGSSSSSSGGFSHGGGGGHW